MNLMMKTIPSCVAGEGVPPQTGDRAIGVPMPAAGQPGQHGVSLGDELVWAGPSRCRGTRGWAGALDQPALQNHEGNRVDQGRFGYIRSLHPLNLVSSQFMKQIRTI
jgi:hypothetical protein